MIKIISIVKREIYKEIKRRQRDDEM